MLSTSELLAQQSEDEERLDQKVDTKMQAAVRMAETALIIWLIANLQIEGGIVLPTAANVTLLQQLPEKFTDLVLQNGYSEALRDLGDWYDSRPAAVGQLLRSIGSPDESPWTPEAQSYLAGLRAANNGFLAQQVVSTGEMMGMISRLGIGAPPQDLFNLLRGKSGQLPARVRTLVMTAASSYQRQVTDSAYREIERVHGPKRYRYAGPPAGDPKIRIFCERLMSQVAAGRTWTRAEIDAMENGQMPNVFVTCGGYDCRHTWLMIF